MSQSYAICAAKLSRAWLDLRMLILGHTAFEVKGNGAAWARAEGYGWRVLMFAWMLSAVSGAGEA